MKKHLRASLVVLCLHFCWVRGKNQVEQSPQSLIILEGDICILQCNYTVSPFNNLRWYKKDTGSRPVSLTIMNYSDSKKSIGRYTVTLDANAKHSSLHITDVQPRDSASYICAVIDRGSSLGRLYFGRGTQLTVWPVIHQPDPSVYKLRGPKSSNTSVCLLTDFASQDNVTQEMKHMVFRSGSTALDVKAMDSKSNGALAWSNSINFECNSAFETYAFYPSSEYSCDAKLVEKSFETDMNLNFQNLSVIALRILLLKVAGFNLLMTLRLWSS